MVYIVHGYTSSSSAEWFPWLKNMLLDKGINVSVFDMPNPYSPVASEWIQHLENNIKNLSSGTYFIGHSLGCITLLRYLENQPDNINIGGIILASGFLRNNPKYPALDPFVKEDLNIEKIIKMTENRIVLSAPNDKYVPYEFSSELAQFLKAKFITVENGGHFIGQEGFFQFPQVYDELCRMIEKSANAFKKKKT